MQEMFERSGELGRHLRAVDWEATPLGPPESWPQSLESVVRLMLTSRFSMWMAWGPELTFFCNDAYRRDTLGSKYPWALGKPATVVWSEIWDDIGPRIDAVMQTGVATWDESLLLFLERSGYPEETYHTFSYSPVFDDDGRVVGMLCVVKEDTEEVVAHRRMQTLRDLGSRHASHLTVTETTAAACRELEDSAKDLPFSLVYLADAEAGTARLAGSVGFKDTHPAAPEEIALSGPGPGSGAGPWPVDEAMQGRTVLVEDLESRFSDLPTGSWDVAPTGALVVPLAAGTDARPYGFQVFGLNRYRPFDDGYRDFCDLIAGRLASAITDARAYEFEKARAETLAQLDQAKTDFFTNVSHEFRTPLTLLLGPAEDAVSDEDEPLTGRQRNRVEVILRNGQRLLKLVNTLLDFSRLESGRVEARFEPVDLAAYTRELAGMFSSAADRLGLMLTINCPPLPAPVWAKVMLNLLSNALKFTFEGAVEVRLTATGSGARLEVADTGTGIPAAELPHLFERFHRVSGAASRTHEGSGIGLALVAELVELHGGTVTATSEPAAGSTFTIDVPYGTEHLPADQVTAPVQAPSARSTYPGVAAVAEGFLSETAHWVGGEPVEGRRTSTVATDPDRPRVLVVDDNADVREYVASLLSQEYQVTTAVDGVDGLALARELPPDLVLTDVMMPRMDGFALLAALQADPLTVGVPVVMVSARAGEEGTLQGLDAGADDYLVKPFTARELMARVRANLELDRARRTRRQLERSRSLLDQAQRLARVGSWEIDFVRNSVEVSNEYLRIVDRTRSEFELLNFDEIFDLVVHPDDRVRVRALLEQPHTQPFSYENRLVRADGASLLIASSAEPVIDEDGTLVGLRGSMQDITERRAADDALALAGANAEAAAREHSIADQLQRSLLPQKAFDLEHLEVATYYRAGVEGTQVGGDWYDVIELGGGRTALVVGDVMGRGVRAAAVMGQLRAAVRAYARLDLPPADLLESLDGLVRDIGEDQIVTCIYAVFDPADQVLRFANAGHLPPIVATPEGDCRVVGGDENPPLGIGAVNLRQHEVELASNARVVLYTDGLVERRGEDLEQGIEALARRVATLTGPVDGVPEELAAAMLPDGPDDDVAILVARADPPALDQSLSRRLEPTGLAVADARHLVTSYLEERGMPALLVQDATLATSELVTNAFLHGQPPVELRMRIEGADVLIEVRDRATYQPRKLRPDEDDEHGRGLQIVAAVAARWGTRPTESGKAVWCLLSARS